MSSTGTGMPVADDVLMAEAPRSLSRDAWHDLQRKPVFWIASALVMVMVLIAMFPWLFSPIDARTAACSLTDSLRPPDGDHWFGFDKQGCDVYSRVIYGARSSVLVGVFSTLIAGVVALLVGMAAGFYGRWIDAVLARVTDVFLGIPPLLGAIVVAKALAGQELGIWPVVLALGLLGWPTPARVIRSSVIAARHQDYVNAARILGAGNLRIMARHILPNALAPMVVVLTIMLGTFIAFEATLSFLGVGPRNTISWGVDIAEAQRWIREASFPLMFPAGFLTATVLAFIMLGDAVREAFDPRLR
ncbi:MAG: ABC transporter permease [Acidobacteria bacterium]|nr:ABC transporter permease [Acidobacteriota bacterium]